MQRQITEIIVGIFFLLGITALTVLAVKVSGLSTIYDFNKTYTISVEFENIGNLKPRARVTISGVTIGRVNTIDFDPHTYLAKVTLAIEARVNHIPNDTQASILTAGLLGDNYIGLTPGFSTDFFKEGSSIPVENTNKAIVLEELISKFVSSRASGLK